MLTWCKTTPKSSTTFGFASPLRVKTQYLLNMRVFGELGVHKANYQPKNEVKTIGELSGQFACD